MVILLQDLRFNFGNASCGPSLANWSDQVTLERVPDAGEQKDRGELCHIRQARI